MDNRPTGRAPNYTTACVVMFGINLSWILIVVWAQYGLSAVVLLGLGLHYAIDWLEVQRRAHAIRSIQRGNCGQRGRG